MGAELGGSGQLLCVTLKGPQHQLLGASPRVFSGEMTVHISRLRRADWPPQCGQAPSHQLKG